MHFPWQCDIDETGKTFTWKKPPKNIKQIYCNKNSNLTHLINEKRIKTELSEGHANTYIQL